MTNFSKYGWEPDPSICGEAAAYVVGDRVLDMVVTPTVAGDIEADVVTDEVLWRGRFPTVRGAKIAAVRAASRIVGGACG